MIARKLEARKSAFAAARKNECGFVDALKSEEGAIDLASIMVGVIVIGVIAGVIAATVFAVIPWSQDKAAQQSLDAVNQAESVAFAQSTDAGAGKYMPTTSGLNLAQKASTPVANDINKNDGAGATVGLLQASGKIVIVSTGTGYKAFSLSATGAIYGSDNTNPNTAVKYTLATANTLITPAVGSFAITAGALVFTPVV